MSSITNIHTRNAPVNHIPRGKKIRADAVAPTVPITVMTSAVTPMRTSARPVGATALPMVAR